MTKNHSGKLIVRALFKHGSKKIWFYLRIFNDVDKLPRKTYPSNITWELDPDLVTKLHHETAFKWASWAYRKTEAVAVELTEEGMV